MRLACIPVSLETWPGTRLHYSVRITACVCVCVCVVCVCVCMCMCVRACVCVCENNSTYLMQLCLECLQLKAILQLCYTLHFM